MVLPLCLHFPARPFHRVSISYDRVSNPSLCTPLTRTSETEQEHRVGASDRNTWQKPYMKKQKANGPYRSPEKPVQINEYI